MCRPKLHSGDDEHDCVEPREPSRQKGDRISGDAGIHRVVAQAMYDDFTTDLRPSLPSIRSPVTVVYAWDPTMPISKDRMDALYQGAYASLPGARLERIDGAYHFLMIDQPAAFATAVDAWLVR